MKKYKCFYSVFVTTRYTMNKYPSSQDNTKDRENTKERESTDPGVEIFQDNIKDAINRRIDDEEESEVSDEDQKITTPRQSSF